MELGVSSWHFHKRSGEVLRVVGGNSDAKPVHSRFAPLGCGSPGGFSCSLSGSWMPTLSSFCECDGEEPVLYGLTVICMKGRPAVCKRISGSNCSAVTGRISRSPCLGRGSWKAFLSSSSRVPRPGAEHEDPHLLAQGGPSSRGSRGEGFPLSSCGFLSPALCPEPFTLSQNNTRVWALRLEEPETMVWPSCLSSPAAVCLLSCRLGQEPSVRSKRR